MYYAAADVARAVGVSRQTLWRWRSEGKVPSGYRFRNGQVVFSEADFAAVRDFATRLIPVDGAPGTDAAAKDQGGDRP